MPKIKTIKIEGRDVALGDAIEEWENAEICRSCINRRLYLNRTYQDHCEDFALTHDIENCMC